MPRDNRFTRPMGPVPRTAEQEAEFQHNLSRMIRDNTRIPPRYVETGRVHDEVSVRPMTATEMAQAQSRYNRVRVDTTPLTVQYYDYGTDTVYDSQSLRSVTNTAQYLSTTGHIMRQGVQAELRTPEQIEAYEAQRRRSQEQIRDYMRRVIPGGWMSTDAFLPDPPKKPSRFSKFEAVVSALTKSMEVKP